MREDSQVSLKDCDSLSLAFNLKPAFPLSDRMKPSSRVLGHTERPRSRRPDLQ